MDTLFSMFMLHGKKEDVMISNGSIKMMVLVIGRTIGRVFDCVKYQKDIF